MPTDRFVSSTRGAASASFADAESEVFAKAFEESGYYVFDGDNARYELVADPKVLAAATKRTGERNIIDLHHGLPFAYQRRVSLFGTT